MKIFDQHCALLEVLKNANACSQERVYRYTRLAFFNIKGASKNRARSDLYTYLFLYH
jgi:hypothetical protein